MTPSELHQNIEEAKGQISALRHAIRQAETNRECPELVEQKRAPLLAAFERARKELQDFEQSVIDSDRTIQRHLESIESLQKRIRFWGRAKEIEKLRKLAAELNALETEAQADEDAYDAAEESEASV